MVNKRQIVCTRCEAINVLPSTRLDENPKCGKCHQPLFQKKSIILNSGNFHRHVARNDIPVLIAFVAEWCAYCRKMAPAFEKAANHLEPFVRLAKVDTEVCPDIAAQYKINGLPTLILFRGNKEIVRQSGALTVEQIVTWVRTKITI